MSKTFHICLSIYISCPDNIPDVVLNGRKAVICFLNSTLYLKDIYIWPIHIFFFFFIHVFLCVITKHIHFTSLNRKLQKVQAYIGLPNSVINVHLITIGTEERSVPCTLSKNKTKIFTKVSHKSLNRLTFNDN